jgi:hypothetical protein
MAVKRIVALAFSALCMLSAVPGAIAGPGVVLSNTQYSCKPWNAQPQWAKKHKQARAHKKQSEQTASRSHVETSEQPGNGSDGAAIVSTENTVKHAESKGIIRAMPSAEQTDKGSPTGIAPAEAAEQK